jgi:protein dithiol oxidoreductase (disulfide-forming)
MNPISRRDFSTTLLGAGAVALSGPAQAQGQPVEGTHYVALSQPVPTSVAGKVEVIEFFWYGCPHCNAFEPQLEGWVRKLPADVAFRRVPVAFRDEPYGTHQRLYYALEAMDLVAAMHRKVFYAIHGERARLDRLDDIVAFMLKNGVDGARFAETFKSFGVQSKARQANQLAAAYKIDGVPALGIQGRWFTSGALAGGNDRALAVTDFLIQRARKAG